MPAETETKFQMGDRVLHPGKPEWGIGLVASAQGARQDGQPCQRLQVRFERGGLKTINTAYVDLQPADGGALIAADPGGDPLATSQQGVDPVKLMTQINGKAGDPFATPVQRLVGTLDLYRFDRDGGSLLDWACAQSGLGDPLTRFNRHELEELFDRWAYLRDQHLAKTVREAKIADPQGVAAAEKNASEPARRALQRAHRRG